MSALRDNESLAVSVAEAARLLGIGRTMAYKCVRTGELPSVTLGGRILIPRAALDLLVTVELNDDRAA